MATEIEPIIQLEFKWEKKSTASTNSLLESDSDDEFLKTVLSPKPDEVKQEEGEVAKEASNDLIQETTEKSSTFHSKGTKTSMKDDEDENKEKDKKNFELALEKSTSNFTELSRNTSAANNNGAQRASAKFLSDGKKSGMSVQFDENTASMHREATSRATLRTEEIHEQDENEKNNQNLVLTHRRYEFSDYSKDMAALDPCSYHQLGLALTDSYLKKSEKSKEIKNYFFILIIFLFME